MGVVAMRCDGLARPLAAALGQPRGLRILRAWPLSDCGELRLVLDRYAVEHVIVMQPWRDLSSK